MATVNPLDTMPQVRKVLYIVQWIVTGIQAVVSAWLTVVSDKPMDRWPTWFVGSLAVAPILWAYLGITASTNVRAP